MILPTVHEISHERALELQREWQQRVVAEQAKDRDRDDRERPERR